jgi:hypothetical protein
MTGIVDALAVNAHENPVRRMMVRNNDIIARIFIIFHSFLFWVTYIQGIHPVARNFPVPEYY